MHTLTPSHSNNENTQFNKIFFLRFQLTLMPNKTHTGSNHSLCCGNFWRERQLDGAYRMVWYQLITCTCSCMKHAIRNQLSSNFSNHWVKTQCEFDSHSIVQWVQSPWVRLLFSIFNTFHLLHDSLPSKHIECLCFVAISNISMPILTH